jgi:hypothetical protein
MIGRMRSPALAAAAFLAALPTCRAQDIAPSPVTTFGTTVVVPAGLRGDIYFLRPGTDHLPNFDKLEPVGAIYTSAINVPPSNFREGFPGVTTRYEWFALNYAGRFWIEKPGKYGFGLISDDGSRLYIDDAQVIDNDGLHTARSAVGAVKLAGGIHKIRVAYFQGPCRSDPCLALILAVQPPGEKFRIFSTNEFKPPPNPEDWKFGDPSQIPPDPNAGRRKLGDTSKNGPDHRPGN